MNVSNGSWNANGAVCAHPEMHLVPTFAAFAPASSVLEEGKYYRLALSGKVAGVSKVRFQILIPRSKTHPGLIFYAQRV
ncbi:hypothetical protein TNCV_2542591 [Trichonephila clavipes]|nr:hypothetical protein TNCV_2542591 [Trichonephila clavipes]